MSKPHRVQARGWPAGHVKPHQTRGRKTLVEKDLKADAGQFFHKGTSGWPQEVQLF